MTVFLVLSIFRADDTVLQGYSEEEFETLVELMIKEKGPQRDAVLRSLRQFPRARNESPANALRKVLDEMWEPIIRPKVEQLLSDCRADALKAVPRIATSVAPDSKFPLKGQIKNNSERFLEIRPNAPVSGSKPSK